MSLDILFPGLTIQILGLINGNMTFCKENDEENDELLGVTI